jgi:hypothetical protein
MFAKKKHEGCLRQRGTVQSELDAHHLEVLEESDAHGLIRLPV